MQLIIGEERIAGYVFQPHVCWATACVNVLHEQVVEARSAKYAHTRRGHVHWILVYKYID